MGSGKGYLCLSRRPGETIMIGDDITITIAGVIGKLVRISIKAPRDLTILRQEIYHKYKLKDNDEVANIGLDLIEEGI